MSAKARFGLIVTGLLLMGYGYQLMQMGKFTYRNYYGQTLFSAGTIALGVLVVVCALLPATRWVYPRISTKARFWRKKSS